MYVSIHLIFCFTFVDNFDVDFFSIVVVFVLLLLLFSSFGRITLQFDSELATLSVYVTLGIGYLCYMFIKDYLTYTQTNECWFLCQ